MQDVTQTAEALEKIDQDEAAFQLLVQSFRAQDYETFHELLNRFDLVGRCELVCRWLCSKECVLVCFELCGPLRRIRNSGFMGHHATAVVGLCLLEPGE